MKLGTAYFTCVLIVVLLAGVTEGIFKCRCGPGCLDRECFCSLGCTNCRPDWCTTFTRRGRSVCTPRCGSGKVCVSAANKRFCTAQRG